MTMTRCKDLKERPYAVIEDREHHYVLECETTRDRITIGKTMFQHWFKRKD